jgi:hypothetical protein
MVSVPFTRQIRLIVAPAWAVLATSSSTAAAAMTLKVRFFISLTPQFPSHICSNSPFKT